MQVVVLSFVEFEPGCRFSFGWLSNLVGCWCVVVVFPFLLVVSVVFVVAVVPVVEVGGVVSGIVVVVPVVMGFVAR